jgi:fatty acid CoA ligase FadD9
MVLRPEHERLLKRSMERCQRRLGEDPELRGAEPAPEAIARIAREPTSAVACCALACELYADRAAFGERAFDVVDGAVQHRPEYRYLTYRELWGRVQAFASGLLHAGLVAAGDRVGICGFSRTDWVVADLACLYLGAVSVPLPISAPPAELAQIAGDAGARCLVVSLEQLGLITAALPKLPTVRGVVVMGLVAADRAASASLAASAQAIREEHAERVAVWPMADLERLGPERGLAPPVEPAAGGPDPLATIMYTSGSTGTPKGAMFPESLWRRFWQRPLSDFLPRVPHVGVNYLPLNHLAGRAEIIQSIVHGGVTSFVLAGDMSTLFEDIRRVRPTRLMLVPRVSGMIYSAYQTELVRRAPGGDEATRERVDAAVVAEMRGSFLGDRLVFALAGTAPTAPEVLSFLERCFDVPVIDALGSTEAGMITLDGRVAAGEVTAWKLTDVPELGYLGTDQPYPRGELRVKTQRLIPGYYRNPEATRELFDEEGFLVTGDVVEQRGDELAWIDRRKNILKLAQGEFVSTSRLEEVFAAQSPFLQQVYVYGDSLRSYLLAVLVPAMRAVEARLGVAPGEAAIKHLLRAELARVAREQGLRGYEVPRDFLIEMAPFTRENGLLTESAKPARPRLRARYGERLSRMYAEIERAQLEQLYARERPAAAEVPPSARVAQALQVALGVPEIDLDQSFLAQGGDSLLAVRLTSILEERFGVRVPVGMVLDPTSSARAVVGYVTGRLGGGAGPRQVTFAEVHGAGAAVVRAADLRVDRFLGAAELDAASRATPASALPETARVALLTGANGFLGRHLLLELLARVPERGGKVVALVRAPTDAAAAERLAAAYRGVDPALWERFQTLAANGRLEVLAADLIKPRLGLGERDHERLAGEVDAIVHDGALVNHALSYPQLFEPNVLGTVEVIRLALARRIKSIAYVSTVGVASGLAPRGPVREDEDGRSLGGERPVDSGYAVGYATSKWACEVLLRDLADRLPIPIGVFRCSMIMAHREYVGQVNPTDFLTRLFLGIVSTGLAPRSFYEGGRRRGRHFDGLPVDFVARAIAAIAVHRAAGHATYHVVNPHWDDGVSLDVLVDWIASAGYAVERVSGYAEWLRRFESRLQALSPTERARSPLPILQQWARPLAASREVRFEASRLSARLAQLPDAPGAIPHLSEPLILRTLRDLEALGLVSPPPHGAATAAQ